MNRCIIVVYFLLIHLSAFAQEYYTKQYKVEDGLPSDIIKSCSQDSLGYFWIATDEGLVKYDGIKFTSYRQVTHSNYAKGFLTTRTGRLLAFTDLDLLEIKNMGDTVIFESLCPVLHVANDSSLSYPKLLFEDHSGAIWVSESQSIVRLSDKSFKRYEFDVLNRTPQFLRSFSFFEDQNKNLFASSYQGNVFKYNREADKFELVKEHFPYGVEFVAVLENQLLVGSAEGLSKGFLLPQGGFEIPTNKISDIKVSYVSLLSGGKYLVGTRGNVQYEADLKKNTFRKIQPPINNVNHIYVSNENDILISGNDGLIVMRENYFQSIDLGETEFIESVTQDPESGIVYVANSQKLYSFNDKNKKIELLLHLPTGYFQSLLFTKQGIWIANAFKVFLFANGKIIKQFDFSESGRFVTNLTADASGNIWLTIPGIAAAYIIDQHLNLLKFNVPLERDGVINLIREVKDGIYIASAGSDTYLYFKPKADSVFKNSSLPLPIKVENNFNVFDFVEFDNKIWLATSHGLFTLQNGKIQQVDLRDKISSMSIKSIRLYQKNKILLVNAFGLWLYNPATDGLDLFNEGTGLSSNTVMSKGLFVGRNDEIWVGTAKGLCYSKESIVVANKTPRPRIIHALANGKKIEQNPEAEIDFDSFISIQFSSITFPNELLFQYRFWPLSEWKSTTESELNIASLPAGKHQLEVRAKKNGPYSWSASSFLSFTISKPIWQRWWFYLILIIAISILVLVTVLWVNSINELRNTELQLLIEERTKALRVSNEELVDLNNEKNNLIGIVAHDLKSPLSQVKGLLGLIKVTHGLSSEAAQYLALMEKSVSRLNEMIVKILDIDAIDSKQLNLRITRLQFSTIINTIVDRYQSDAALKGIKIILRLQVDSYFFADQSYCEQILDNLLSNAIKFSPFDRNVFIILKKENGKAICEIKDEGLGLSEGEVKKLFGKYQKLTPKPTGNEISTGLGLSIAKKYAMAMNAAIWCESELGKGSSFFVSFQESVE